MLSQKRILGGGRELDIAGLMDELVKTFYSDKRGFYQLMSKTQFMSVALIVIGLCSRLSVISKAWTHELADCYSLLEQWIKAFPKNESLLETVDYEKELPDSLDSLIAASLPDIIPDTPLPTTLVEPTQQQSSAEGIDLGEVIQRAELPEPALEASLSLPQHKTSQPSRKAAPLKRKVSENDEGDDRIDLSTPTTKIHDSLLGELDTVFGNKDSSSKPAQGSSSVISAIADMSEAIDEKNEIKVKKKRKRRTNKTTTVEMSQSTPSSPGQNSISKSTGSTTNFDDIFNLDQERPVSVQSSPGGTGNTLLKKNTILSVKMSQSDKSDIEDIFSSIEKPKKKKKKTEMSEIDAIFGPPKKKKKAKSMEQ
ncbi:hypothetical protein BG011_007243 [Mortierella polycephala]|uniref:Uncharacterized protein n=1 Tax=Mortierella polycephala TaxID=41804 RepID=A0A9P6QEK0_9FUNG|nr:hypothetical protein BG011_007243 [Mortierella polycephala]